MHSIFKGTISHSRKKDAQHSFTYDTTMLFLDLDDIKNAFTQNIFWSYEKFNLASFYRKDFFVNYTGELYFWNPFYDDYPVVGINYSQATAFCHWRTNLYNNFAKEKGLSKAVKYELPSIDDMYTISKKSSQLHQEAGKAMYWGGLLDPEPLSVLNRFYESEVQYRKELSKYLKKLGEVKSKGQLDKEELNYPF